jgi:hypothetical protein
MGVFFGYVSNDVGSASLPADFLFFFDFLRFESFCGAESGFGVAAKRAPLAPRG